MDGLSLLARAPVMPVIVIRHLRDAVPLARALAAGGITTLEITLRSDVALEAIRAIRSEVPEAIVGAGTVLTPDQLQRAMDAGAQFAISPGLTPELAVAARDASVCLVPGVATASEAMRASDYGFGAQKLFPAEAVGGTALLKALAGPLPHLRFCPTGGINPANAPDYLNLPNVPCVGGSWLAPEAAVAAGDWPRITRLAQEALQLRG